MLERLLLAAVAGSCSAPPAMIDKDGGPAVSAIAVHVPDDAEAVFSLLVEARRLLADTPEEALLPNVVTIAYLRANHVQSLQFPPGPPPEVLHVVYLVDPEEAFGDAPVWYDAETGRISFCRACTDREPVSKGLLGLLYARALFDQATLPSVTDEASALAREMNGTLLMLGAANRASQGKLVAVLMRVLSDPELSDPVTPESPWRIPSDTGWTYMDLAWPWRAQSSLEADVSDDVIHLSCALLQGKTPKQRAQAFLQIWEYTTQGC